MAKPKRKWPLTPPAEWPEGLPWPPEPPSLEASFEKLRWAKQHLATLRREIEPFEQRDTHSVRYEVDLDQGKYTFYVSGLEEPDNANWGLMVGDCLHNARTALDYLM